MDILNKLKNQMGKISKLLHTNTSELSDGKLLGELHKTAHFMDKKKSEGDRTNPLDCFYCRSLYKNALDRGLVSECGKKWFEHILESEKLKGKNMNLFESSFHELYLSRRSVRKFKKEKIPEEIFQRLFDSALWAPSSCNRQAWHFIKTSDSGKIKLISRATNQKWIKEVPYLILCCFDRDCYSVDELSYTPYLDVGMAIENVLLCSTSLGLSSCVINFGKAEVSEKDRDKVVNKFKIPENIEVVTVIALGYSDVDSNPPGRKIQSTITHNETYER